MSEINYPSRKKVDSQEVTNRDVNAAQRAVLAVQLRAQMLTYEEIAKRFDLKPTTVRYSSRVY